ncbi:hypothetical protein N7490_005510 [Penicillium lividum]|nr:hypothetical protein N7490_005510 [Penicillium lividum]
MTSIPVWQLPELRNEDAPTQTWMVVFLCPMEEEKRDEIMQNLITVDKNWPDRPSGEPRRLLQVPWLLDTPAHPSILSSIVRRTEKADSLIFVDEQALKDDLVILVHYDESGKKFESLRAPIHRANVLLSAAAEGTVLEGMPLPDDAEATMKQGTKSYGETPVFILEEMTEEELQKIKDLLHEDYHYDLDWIDVSHKLEIPDIESLLEYFESEEHEMQSPPWYFLAVDRTTLEFAKEPEGKKSEIVILASQEAGKLQFCDEVGDEHSKVCMGYGLVSQSVGDAMDAVVNLSLANMDFCEIAPAPEYVYWKGYQAWVDVNMDDYEGADKSFASVWIPGEGRVDIERY